MKLATLALLGWLVVWGPADTARAALSPWATAAAKVFAEYRDTQRKTGEGPLSVEDLTALLDAAEAVGDWATALDTSASLATATGNPAFLARGAWIAALAGDFEAAEAQSDAALAADPDLPLALCTRALLRWDWTKEDPVEALSFLQSILDTDPINPEALSLRALILLMAGEPQKALEPLLPVLSGRSPSPWPLAVAGACAWRLGQRDRARHWWRLLEASWPAHPAARLARYGFLPVGIERSGARVLLAAFSSDGKRLAFQSSGQLVTVAATRDLDTPLAEGKVPAQIAAVAWQAGDTAVLVAGYSRDSRREVQLWRWIPGQEARLVATAGKARRNRVLTCYAGGALYLSYWRQGRRYQQEMRRLTPEGEDVLFGKLPLRGLWPTAAAISADGARVVVRHSAYRLLGWDVKRGTLSDLLESSLAVKPAQLVAGGQVLPVMVRTGTYYSVAALPVDGFAANPLILLPGQVRSLAVSPDGSLAAVYTREGTRLVHFAGTSTMAPQ